MDAKFSHSAAKRDAIASPASDGGPLALPRACRLVHRVEYDAVYREGRRRTSREFTVFLRPNGLGVSRFGWSIKKALGSAVRRNRIRRRIRETLRLHRQEIAPGWDIVIHPRSSVATAKFLVLAAELVGLLPRAEKATQ
ncbi:MAG TPA: ribonuclease P protein component [Candidatus Acidoferrales bacterium]|nr:ribonuclease P protein component [Candidatus Acidoferrales bacterium]